MIVRKTRPEEARRVNELFAIAFDLPFQNCPADPENDRAHHYAAFEDDDKTMMGTLTISDFHIHFDGHLCKMGGVGGVATLPQYRRRGGIRGCFEKALPELYREGYDFSYLYPFSTAYYRKFGYESCVKKLGWTVNLGQLRPGRLSGRFCLSEPENPMTGALRLLDGLWENRFNMMVRHGEEDYRWAMESDPARTRESTYVCFDGEGTPKGYVTFKTAREPEGRCLSCSRFCFADREGFALLLELFSTMATDYACVKFQTPFLPELMYLMPEWSLGAVKWEVLQNAGMVRVVNAEQILRKAKYRGSGRVVLALDDPQIPENRDTFAVVFSEGRAAEVTRTGEAPHARLTIPAFSALMAGVMELREARHTLNGLEVLREGELEKVFYRKPLMIRDYF